MIMRIAPPAPYLQAGRFKPIVDGEVRIIAEIVLEWTLRRWTEVVLYTRHPCTTIHRGRCRGLSRKRTALPVLRFQADMLKLVASVPSLRAPGILLTSVLL